MEKNILLSVLLLFLPAFVFAEGGTTDYSMGSRALVDMNVQVVAFATIVLRLVYIIASILAIISATNIYIKLQSGNQDFIRSVFILFGSCIYIVIATIVLPKFFGLNYGNI